MEKWQIDSILAGRAARRRIIDECEACRRLRTKERIALGLLAVVAVAMALWACTW